MATMIKRGILGTKIGMTRVFREDGEAIACTLVEAGPCTVVQRKTAADDGYDAIQLGFGSKREKLVTKPMKGHFKKAGDVNFRFLREVRLYERLFTRPDPGADRDLLDDLNPQSETILEGAWIEPAAALNTPVTEPSRG